MGCEQCKWCSDRIAQSNEQLVVEALCLNPHSPTFNRMVWQGCEAKEVRQDQITIYQIPADTVRYVLALDDEEVMSQECVPEGLFTRDGRAPRTHLVYLRRLHEPGQRHLDDITFRRRMFRVSDVAEFARNYVPEDPPAGASFAGEVRDTAVALACGQAEQIQLEKGLTL